MSTFILDNTVDNALHPHKDQENRNLIVLFIDPTSLFQIPSFLLQKNFQTEIDTHLSL